VRENQQYDKYNNEKVLANTHQDKIRLVGGCWSQVVAVHGRDNRGLCQGEGSEGA
jgi:hypothetical protein